MYLEKRSERCVNKLKKSNMALNNVESAATVSDSRVVSRAICNSELESSVIVLYCIAFYCILFINFYSASLSMSHSEALPTTALTLRRS